MRGGDGGVAAGGRSRGGAGDGAPGAASFGRGKRGERRRGRGGRAHSAEQGFGQWARGRSRTTGEEEGGEACAGVGEGVR